MRARTMHVHFSCLFVLMTRATRFNGPESICRSSAQHCFKITSLYKEDQWSGVFGGRNLNRDKSIRTVETPTRQGQAHSRNSLLRIRVNLTTKHPNIPTLTHKAVLCQIRVCATNETTVTVIKSHETFRFTNIHYSTVYKESFSTNFASLSTKNEANENTFPTTSNDW